MTALAVGATPELARSFGDFLLVQLAFGQATLDPLVAPPRHFVKEYTHLSALPSRRCYRTGPPKPSSTLQQQILLMLRPDKTLSVVEIRRGLQQTQQRPPSRGLVNAQLHTMKRDGLLLYEQRPPSGDRRWCICTL